jgi:hypothetical protein
MMFKKSKKKKNQQPSPPLPSIKNNPQQKLNRPAWDKSGEENE